jgi:hypothetical protein
MNRNNTTLWSFLRKALRHTWLWLSGIVWSLFGSATRIRDNFLPEHWKNQLQTHRLLSWIPRMGWPGLIAGLLVLLLIAIVRSARLQIREVEQKYFDAEDELDQLKGAPLAVDLEIHEVLQRPSLETHAYWNRDVFLRVSASLTSPHKQDVVYQLGLILRGKTLDAEWLNDVGDWCRTKIVRQPSPFTSQADEPCYLMDGLPTSLTRGVKVDGWLHFRTNSGMEDSLMGKCVVRLIARSPNGASHCDKAEGTIPVLPGDWKIIRKKDALEYEGRTLEHPLPPPV